jgi:ABC-type multidrug transport system ATPase subunit
MTPVSALEQVGLTVGGHRILDGVSLRADAGEIVALFCPSGAGKSSVLRIILGFATPTQREVRIQERLVSRAGRLIVAPEERCRPADLSSARSPRPGIRCGSPSRSCARPRSG